MASTSQEVRQKVVAGAADMIRRRGLAATSIRELAKHAGAPLGSTYHYFPGGKQQLATEAVQFAGGLVGNALGRKLQRGPVEGLKAFLDHWRAIVVGSDYQAGCPVLAVAVEEASTEEAMAVQDVAAEVFRDWERLLADSLREHGAEGATAEQLATLIVAAAEGAIALCRAGRSTTPLDNVATQLDALVRAAVTPSS